MEKNILTIVVCGEVDHGKSTLLGRILCDTRSLPDGKWAELERVCRQMGRDIEPAYLLDQLEEERQEAMTIDTTQVFLKTRKRRYCLIDTPGHLEFIKNMMTGATQADAAVLIVDATVGVVEQTQRHARLLKMLGVDRFIVAVNKMDLAGFSKEKFEGVQKKVSGFLRRLGLKPVAMIPIAAKEGHNIFKLSDRMKWYRGPSMIKALDSLCGDVSGKRAPLRFPIQDVYKIGSDSIIVGRVESGFIKVGQRAIVYPCGQKTKISAIKVFNRKKTIAHTGDSIGLVLSCPGRVRGEVICSTVGKPTLNTSFDGHIFWFAQKPLKINGSLKLRCATQEVGCVLTRIHERMDSATREVLERGANEVGKNELARVTFRVRSPMVIENFDVMGSLGRFVLENDSAVCGFGIKR